jgi:2-polyprenyl-3-methyl-5-hydroxy-6-metoxy-1,4-benzoquinol methylase
VDLRERSAPLARRHPWEIARAAFFRNVLESHDLLSTPARWLDVGAGDAWLATELRGSLPEGTEIVCWDINYSEDELAGAATTPGVVLTAGRPTGRFDRILLLDVIEHVADDHAFLGGILSDLLAPGGRVLVSVPAYQALFSRHDVALGHYRRYSPRQGRALLDAEGLERVVDGGVFHLLLLPRALAVVVQRLRRAVPAADDATGVGQWTGGARLTRAIVAILRGEGAISRRLGRRKLAVPGLSYWALCRLAD